MTQFSTFNGNGLVAVTKGTNLVQHVWKTFLLPGGGPFTPGETITWAGGGSGVVTAYDSSFNTLNIRNDTPGSPLSLNLLVTSSITGNTGTISSFDSGSPPKYSIQLNSGDFFVRSGFASIFQVNGVPTFDDQFELTTLYGDDSSLEANFSVSRDFTPTVGLVVLNPGDQDSQALLGWNMMRIDALVGAPVWTQIPFNEASFAVDPVYGSPEYFKSGNGLVYLQGGALQTNTNETLFGTLPSGVRPQFARSYEVARLQGSGSRLTVVINADGTIILSNGNAAGVSLNGIFFDSNGGT